MGVITTEHTEAKNARELKVKRLHLEGLKIKLFEFNSLFSLFSMVHFILKYSNW